MKPKDSLDKCLVRGNQMLKNIDANTLSYVLKTNQGMTSITLLRYHYFPYYLL